jgi:hypothetical protein
MITYEGLQIEENPILVYFTHFSSLVVVSCVLFRNLETCCLETEWLKTEWLEWKSVRNQYRNTA